MINKKTIAPTFGAIYVASGEKYVAEALVSASSLKQVMPEIPIHLHTDLDKVSGVFDQISKLEFCRYNCYDKAPPLLNPPFEFNLFLDTDTYVCCRLDELKPLLERYDLLVCHTAFRDPNPLPGVPEAFTEFNTGMIAFRSNARTKAFFKRWLDNYAQMNFRADQPAFRKALWEDDDLRVYILPPEYNFRTIFPGFIGGGSEVKIIHGRHRNWEWIRNKLNASRRPRVVLLSPLSRWGNEVIVIRKWTDLFKSFVKSHLSK